MSDYLIDAILIALFAAVVALVFVLCRLYMVLTDVNATSRLVKKRSAELDKGIDEFVESLNRALDMVKGIKYSLSGLKKIKSKIDSFLVKEDKEDNHE